MGTEIENRSLEETAEVLEWRYTELRRAGYPEREALALATSEEVDLHLACDLLRRGCPSDTAVRILV